MKVITVEQGSDEWLKAREGKITGSKLKDVYSTGMPNKADVMAALDERSILYKKTLTIAEMMDLLPAAARQELKAKIPKKLGFYELVAEKIAYEKGDENPMERGKNLEDEAREKLALYLDTKIDTIGLCVHDKNPDIAVSPDGVIFDRKHNKIFEAVEIKCLSTARHIQALVERRVPDEYWYQVLQYFIVIETLEVLHFCFYDPRLVGNELCVITIERDQVKDEAEALYNDQSEMMAEVNDLAQRFSNF